MFSIALHGFHLLYIALLGLLCFARFCFTVLCGALVWIALLYFVCLQMPLLCIAWHCIPLLRFAMLSIDLHYFARLLSGTQLRAQRIIISTYSCSYCFYISPNRFICRGSGGFGKRAGYRIRPPRGLLCAQIRCKYQYKIDISSKTQCFLMVFDEKRDSS